MTTTPTVTEQDRQLAREMFLSFPTKWELPEETRENIKALFGQEIAAYRERVIEEYRGSRLDAVIEVVRERNAALAAKEQAVAILRRIHEALGEHPGSDDESLPEVVAEKVAAIRELRERLERAERQLQDLPRYVSEEFYVRHDHMYSGLVIHDWAERLVKRLRGTPPKTTH